MSETTSKPLSNLTRWIIGLCTIIFFPFTIAIVALYVIFYKVPVFVGMGVEETINGIRDKWAGR
jgi:hypothetical protein